MGGGVSRPKCEAAPELKDAASLGIIRLDYDYEAAPGDIDHPGSYAYDVHYKVVPGLTFGLVQAFRGIDEATGVPYSTVDGTLEGEKVPMPDSVRDSLLSSVRSLIEMGCDGITGDCGFMLWLQVMIRRAEGTDVPVFMSSLAQLPAVTCGYGKDEKILVVTANGESLNPMRQLIRDECGMEEGVDGKRFIICGTEMVPIFGEAVAKGEKVPWEEVTPHMVERVQGVLNEHKGEDGKCMIRGILLECTELPPYSDALRAATGLPVWDAITNCDFFVNGYVDNPRFGTNDFQAKWDGVQEEYTFADNLTEEEKAELVNKPQVKVQAVKNKTNCTPAKPYDAAKQRALQSHAALGVIRLDYDYEAAPGDIDCPDSFSYDVYYRAVPGLTFELVQSFVGINEETGVPYGMAEDGTTQVPMSDKVMPDGETVVDKVIKAVEYFEEKGVSGITGDCGFMMWMQTMVRRKTHLPVFMSSLAQLPAVECGFGMDEQIMIMTANGESLKPMRQLIRDECGVDPEDGKRFLFVGTEMVPIFGEAVAKGEKVDWKAVEPHMVARAKEVIAANPRIKAILAECTELPPYSDILRKETGLPVYDAITCCDMFINARVDNPRFGATWQKGWDGTQVGYKFGQNATIADQAQFESAK